MGAIIKKFGKGKDPMGQTKCDKPGGLYKPIEEFAWKDANKRQRKELAIQAYRSTAY